MVHPTRATLSDVSIPEEERWTHLVDVTKGFNTGDRGKILFEVREHFPKL